MQYKKTMLLRAAAATALAMASAALITVAEARSERPLYISPGSTTRAPIGWIDFCIEHADECHAKPLEPRDIVLTTKSWSDLVRINSWVNEHIRPLTDLEHWGVVERWNTLGGTGDDLIEAISLGADGLVVGGLLRPDLFLGPMAS